MSKIASLNIARKKLSELKPHPRNPRVHPDEQKSKLQYLIEKYSYAKGSIVVQEKTNTILAGHGIYDALKANGYIEADVVMVPFDDGMAEAFMIADNKVGELSEWDDIKLTEILDELKMQDIDLAKLGFDSDIENLLDQIENGNEINSTLKLKENKYIILSFKVLKTRVPYIESEIDRIRSLMEFKDELSEDEIHGLILGEICGNSSKINATM